MNQEPRPVFVLTSLSEAVLSLNLILELLIIDDGTARSVEW